MCVKERESKRKRRDGEKGRDKRKEEIVCERERIERGQWGSERRREKYREEK